MIESATCTTCGSAVPESFAQLGRLCPTCLIFAARPPCSLDDRTQDPFTTRWADAFPQFELGKSLRNEGDLRAWEACDLDRNHRPVILQVVSGAALEEAGGASLLLGRANRLRDLAVRGLARILDAGDLTYAFFLVTDREESWVTAATGLDSNSEDELANLLAHAADTLAAVRNAGLSTTFDLRTAFLDPTTKQLILTPSALPPSAEDELANRQAVPQIFILAAGVTLDGFELEEHIGEGGFGEVWRARQHRPVKRQVALKVLKHGLASPRLLARFEVEQQALARLDHSHIARFFDGDTTPDGRPFFAMEWIEGDSITRFCDAQKAPLPERLRLFREVCEAVQHAHQKGIIHRDLKPSNVMVSRENGTATVKVIDFGIARALEEPLTDQTLLTRAEELIGTPATMSPEQTRGDEPDARTDVFGLGALLYELLTGALPFDPQLPYDELRQKILEDDPPLPSQRVTADRQLRGDLDWIVMKCLEKDPERRYASVGALIRDLERHTNDEPVEAGAPELGYRIRKFVRRNNVVVVAAAIVALSVMSGLILATVGLARAKSEAAKSREAEEETVSALRTTAETLTDSRSATGFLHSDLGNNRTAALWFAYAAHHSKDPNRGARNKRRFLEETRTASLPIAARMVERPSSWDLTFSPGGELLRIMTFHGGGAAPVKRVEFLPVSEPERFTAIVRNHYLAGDVHPHQPLLALVDQDGVLIIYDWKRGEVLERLDHLDRNPAEVSYSHDGMYLAIGGTPRGNDGTFGIAVLPVADLDKKPIWSPIPDRPVYLEWNPNNRFLVTGAGESSIQFFRFHPGSRQLLLTNKNQLHAWIVHFGTMQRPQFSSPPQRDSVLVNQAWVHQFDLESGVESFMFPPPGDEPVRGFAYAPDLDNPDGAPELLAAYGSEVIAVNSDGGTKVAISETHFVSSFTPTPDGAHVLVGSEDGRALLYDRMAQSGTAPLQIGSHSKQVKEVAVSRDGLLMATAQDDGLVRVWRPRVQGAIPDVYLPTHLSSPRGEAPATVQVSLDQKFLAAVPLSHDDNVQNLAGAWSLSGSLTHLGFFSNGQTIRAGCFSPSEPDLLITAHSKAEKGELAVWSAAATTEVAARIPLAADPRAVSFSPDGQKLAVLCANGSVAIVDVEATRFAAETIHEGDSSEQDNWQWIHNGKIGFSRGGKFLIVWETDGKLRVWNTDNNELAYTIKLEDVVFQIHLVGENYFCTSSHEGLIQWWHLSDGTPAPFPTLRHHDKVFDIDFSKDGEQLITSCRDHFLRVWDWKNGDLLHVMQHDDQVTQACVTESGNLVTGGEHRYLRLWDPTTGRPLSPRLGAGRTRSLTMLRNGQHEFVLAGAADGGVFGYDLLGYQKFLDLSRSECLELAEIISSQTISAGGAVKPFATGEWLRRWDHLTLRQREFLRESYPINEVSWLRWKSDQSERKTVRYWYRKRLEELEADLAETLELVEGGRTAFAAMEAATSAAESAVKEEDWPTARQKFEAAISYLGTDTPSNLSRTYGAVLLRLGDWEAFRQHCGEFLKRSLQSDSLDDLTRAAMQSLSLPFDQRTGLLGITREAIDRMEELCNPSSSYFPWVALNRGMVEYRSRNPAEAIHWLKIAESGRNYRQAAAYAVHALCAQDTDAPIEAVTLLAEAEDQFSSIPKNTVFVETTFAEQLLKEARAAVENPQINPEPNIQPKR